MHKYAVGNKCRDSASCRAVRLVHDDAVVRNELVVDSVTPTRRRTQRLIKTLSHLKGVICDEDFTTCARGDDDLWHGGSSEAMKSQLGEYIDTIKPTAASKDSPLLTMKNMHDFSSYRRCLAKCLELGVL